MRYPRVGVTPRSNDAVAGWWRRRSIELSPAAALAWAAGLAAIVSVGTLRAVASGQGTPVLLATVTQPAPAETVHVVRFVFRDAAAQHVALVGDFNGWAKDATPLAATSEAGAWAVSVTMPKGRHEYAFIVDGQRWSSDPFASRVADEFGTESSVVTVGSPTGVDDSSRKSD
jgi:1,4-alpha-glucan branching enzyme